MYTLIPKPIIDKNGKHTTVHVRPDASTKRLDDIRTTNTLTLPRDEDIAAAPVNWEKDGKKLVHTTIQLPGLKEPKVFKVAPDGYSGCFCHRCAAYFETDVTSDIQQCATCGKTCYGGLLESAIRYSDLPFTDTENVRDATWFHITLSPEWDTDITEGDPGDFPLVHLGSMDAATARMNDLMNDDSLFGRKKNAEFYCYEIIINDDAAISPYIVSDMNDEAPESINSVKNESLYDTLGITEYEEMYDEYELEGITRYVNEVEARGSISLIAHPDSFTVVNRIKL